MSQPARPKSKTSLKTSALPPLQVRGGWWLVLVLTLLVFKGAFDYNGATEEWGWQSWLVALALTVVLFGSVLLHEIGHTLVAIRLGIPVRRITLYIGGGLSEIPDEPDTPKREFWIALAGPLVSLGLGLLFGLGWLMWSGSSAVEWLFLGSAGINFLLAAFNLLPGLPMDGGKALRAALWQRLGDYEQATVLASRLGAIIGGVMLVGGLLLLPQRGQAFMAYTLAFTGLFVVVSAIMGGRYSRWNGRLRGATVGRLLHHDYEVVASSMLLATLITDYLFRRNFVLVADETGAIVGMVHLTDVKKVAADQWARVTATSVMQPLSALVSVSPDTSAVDAARQLRLHKAELALVFDYATPSPALLGLVAQKHLHALARKH